MARLDRMEATMQLMLQKMTIETEDGTPTAGQPGLDPIMTLYLISPAATVALVPLMFAVEFQKLLASSFFSVPGVATEFTLMVLVTGLLAFCLIFLELQLVHLTSSLTCSICGVIKELLTITASVLFFSDVISGLNMAGMAVSVTGILGYNLYRRRQELTGRSQNEGYAKVAVQPLEEYGLGSDSEVEEALEVVDENLDESRDESLHQ